MNEQRGPGGRAVIALFRFFGADPAVGARPPVKTSLTLTRFARLKSLTVFSLLTDRHFACTDPCGLV